MESTEPAHRREGRPRTSVIIPTYNEAASIGRVLDALPPDWFDEAIVVDNGSTDSTAAIARRHGARVVTEPRRGYGRACLAGVAAAEGEILVFLDADLSDFPEELPRLLRPILHEGADLVIGTRVPERREPGAMAPHVRFGNWLAAWLIRRLWGYAYADLGPFRAIRAEALRRLNLEEKTYGWTVEMQIKALLEGLKVAQAPVAYRRRIGASKISGTLGGSIGAAAGILGTIVRWAWRSRRGGPPGR